LGKTARVGLASVGFETQIWEWAGSIGGSLGYFNVYYLIVFFLILWSSDRSNAAWACES
jgi:hypothetical protein